MAEGDRNDLTYQMDRIEEKVDNTFSEVGFLKREMQQMQSYNGPIGQMMQNMATNEQKVKSAHIRIDDHDKHIDKIRGTLWSIVWKVLLVGAAGGGTMIAVTELVLRFTGG